MPFKPGQSGNPAGRPRGARNKSTVIVNQLLGDKAGELTTAAITQAIGGDPAAMRGCMDRVAPRPRHERIDFDLPNLVALEDTPGAISAIGQGLAHGELDLEHAEALLRVVREFRSALAAVEAQKLAGQLATQPRGGEATGGPTLADLLAARTA